MAEIPPFDRALKKRKKGWQKIILPERFWQKNWRD
jgi:hypothetical protein